MAPLIPIDALYTILPYVPVQYYHTFYYLSCSGPEKTEIIDILYKIDKRIYRDAARQQCLPTVIMFNFGSKFHWNDKKMYNHISEKTIEVCKERINWKYVSKYAPSLSEEFVWKWNNKLDIGVLLQRMKFSEQILRLICSNLGYKYKYMNLITTTQVLSEKFIMDHIKYINIMLVQKYQPVPWKFIKDLPRLIA